MGNISAYDTLHAAPADGVSSFKSTVFCRCASQPSTPEGGSYSRPVPDGTLWSDGIPGGEAILWASTRIFTSDGSSPQQGVWSTPKQMTDTADFDVAYHDGENYGGKLPTTHHASNQGNGWKNTATTSTIWMATDRKKNGAWEGWQVSRIKGEKGEGVSIISTLVRYASSTSGTTRPSADSWMTTVPSVENGNYLWTWTQVTYSDGSVTDTYSVSRMGVDGKGIKSSAVSYSQKETQTDPSGITDWSPNYPASLQEGWWLYVKTVITYSEGAPTTSYSVSQVGTGAYYAGLQEYYAAGTSGMHEPENAPFPGDSTGDFRQYDRDETVPISTPWQQTRPNLTIARPFLWNFSVSFDSAGNKFVTKPICIGNFAKGIQSIVETYAISAYSTAGADGYPTDITSWTDEQHDAAPTDARPYQWNKTETTYNNGDTDTWYHISAVKGGKGDKGDDGADGNGILKQTSLFLLSNKQSGITAYDEAAGWDTNFPEPTAQLPYVWKCVKTEYTDKAPEFSTPELVATYSGVANINLLKNAAFTSDDNLDAWTVRSHYLPKEGQTVMQSLGSISSTQNVGGYNSYHDTCAYTDATVNYKDVLQQVIHDSGGQKLKPSTWYTLSFYAKGWYGENKNGRVTVYLYPGITDTSAGVFADGEELTGVPADARTYFALNKEWSYHKISFKTKGTLPDAKGYVLFRMFPTAAADIVTSGDVVRHLYLCLPKLEEGMIATGFVPNAEDAKGDRGAVMRGPQMWEDVADGYAFQAGKAGDYFLDVVIKGGYYYSCKKNYAKGSVRNGADEPGEGASWSDYWYLGDSFNIVATKVLLAENAILAGWKFANQRLESQTAAADGTPTAYLDGANGTASFAGGNFSVDESGNVHCDANLTASSLHLKEIAVTENGILESGSYIFGCADITLPELPSGECMSIKWICPMITRVPAYSILRGANQNVLIVTDGNVFNGADTYENEEYGCWDLFGTKRTNDNRTFWFLFSLTTM